MNRGPFSFAVPPVLVGWLVLTAGAVPAVRVLPAITRTNESRTFELLEWNVELDRTYNNPFDPEAIAVDGLFTTWDGKAIKIPAFWYQDFQRPKPGAKADPPHPVGNPGWRLRFAAPTAGNWKLQVFARDATGEGASEPIGFKVVRDSAPGFVRRSPHNDRYFQFDSGDSYFIVGYILGWASLDEYEEYLTKMAQAGGNYTRVWISPPNPVLETREAGLGRYDLYAAWFYDQILHMAQERGIRVLLTLKNYRDLMVKDVWGEAPWPVSPYNRANCGPLERPADFFTDATARKLYQRHLRDLIARYSAYTSLGFWEFWNEQDNMELGSDGPWIREMSEYLEIHDPYRHPITTSYGALGPSAVWDLPTVDLTQRHFYGDEGSVHNVVPVILADARRHDAFHKPHLMGELGISWRRSDDFFDPQITAANLHCGLWASALSGHAGGATIWYWYDYIVPRNLWSQLTPLARFATKVDWARSDFQPFSVSSPNWDSNATKAADIVFDAGGAWGKADPEPLVVGTDGLVTSSLPTFLYGPNKPDFRTPLTLKVTLPKETTLLIRVARASAPCRLQVKIDGVPEAVYPFKPLPETPPTNAPAGAVQYPLHPVAEADRNQQLPVPAGRHELTLDLVDGDWLTLESITLREARAPGITGLEPVALADARSGETLVWLHDPDANWYSDFNKIPLRRFEGVRLELPVPRPGRYSATWWDTYRGEAIRTDEATSDKGRLTLHPPAFQRDIALRALLEAATDQASPR